MRVVVDVRRASGGAESARPLHRGVASGRSPNRATIMVRAWRLRTRVEDGDASHHGMA